jgi:hypothetical protein
MRRCCRAWLSTVEWEIPGAFHMTSKAVFDKEIENPAFTGRPSASADRQ